MATALFVVWNAPGPQKPKSPAIVSRLADSGKTITLDADGHLRGLEQAPPELQALVARALRDKTLPPAPALADLQRPPDTLLGGTLPGDGVSAQKLFGFEPAGVVTPDTHPRFQWRAPAGARSYVVAVYTTDFQQVAVSSPIATPEWTCTQALKPGTTYLWTVSAVINGSRVTAPSAPEPEARFRVATDAERSELQAARATGSQFAVAVTATRLGMLGEAHRALERLNIPDFGQAGK
jgi:hypothetical protein